MGLVSSPPLEDDWVAILAGYLGASGPALRLLISLLFAYPLLTFHRLFLYKKHPIIQNIFFILGGSYIGYFNYGDAILHAYICAILQYLVIVVAKGNLVSTVFLFAFQMTYLLGEYYLTETAMYDIKWTIPHCVLTIRLMGQAFDIFDGTKDPDDLSKDQKETALKKIPSLLDCLGHVFYPGSFMIGPQFPLKRYLDYVEGKFSGEDGKAPASVGPGLKRLLLGVMYVGIFQVGSLVVNNDYILSPEYQSLAFWKRLVVVGIYGKVLLYKYVSCWIVSEGACIMSGISYNGKDDKGVARWDGCENINIVVFEKAYKFSHIIASFNKCTNKWVAQNIFKRLKFVGNKYVSQGAALLFLAVWHGLHSGYYVCFFLEFIVMKTEKDLERILSKNAMIQRWHNNPIGFWIDVVVCKVLVTVFFGFCTLSFGLLKFEKWWLVYKDLYFIGFIIFGLWPLYAPFINKILNPRPRSSISPASKSQADSKPEAAAASSSHSNGGLKQD